jgi:hypothetical protein
MFYPPLGPGHKKGVESLYSLNRFKFLLYSDYFTTAVSAATAVVSTVTAVVSTAVESVDVTSVEVPLPPQATNITEATNANITFFIVSLFVNC